MADHDNYLVAIVHFFLNQQFITQSAMAVHAYRRNYV